MKGKMSLWKKMKEKAATTKTFKTATIVEQFKAMTPPQQRHLWTFLTAMKAAENLGKTNELEEQLNEWIRTDKAAYIKAVRERMGIDED